MTERQTRSEEENKVEKGSRGNMKRKRERRERRWRERERERLEGRGGDEDLPGEVKAPPQGSGAGWTPGTPHGLERWEALTAE